MIMLILRMRDHLAVVPRYVLGATSPASELVQIDSGEAQVTCPMRPYGQTSWQPQVLAALWSICATRSTGSARSEKDQAIGCNQKEYE